MSIAASVALLLTAASAAGVNHPLPPLVINVAAVSNVSPNVVSLAEREVETIFRATGVRFIWRTGEDARASLVVEIANASTADRDGRTQLGWLAFENGAPIPRIHLSYSNAERYLISAREVVGLITAKTMAERETLMGRLIGRALAHELGHYLLGMKEHTTRGLMKGAPTAQEFFSTNPGAFAIDPAERTQIASRLAKPIDLARVRR